MGHNSFCGTHSDIGTEPESASRHAATAESHKVTIEVRDERSRDVVLDAEKSLQSAAASFALDAFSFCAIAFFAKYAVISNAIAALLLGGVVGARLAECRVRFRARAVGAVTVVLLGLWGVLSLCARS